MVFTPLTIVSIIIIALVVPVFGLRSFRKLGILEKAKRAKYYKRKPAINAQGIWTRITLLGLVLLLGRSMRDNTYLIVYLIAGSLLVILSSIDLFYSIPSRLRLMIQIILFGGIVLYGGVEIDTIRLGSGDVTIIKRLGVLGSIAWFILCTNAINRFDGIQGQASGVTSVGAFSLLAVVSLIVIPSYGDTLTLTIQKQLIITQIIALSLGIVSLIYTIIEYKPIGLVRDIGTTVFGFSLAYLALLGGAKVGTLVVVLSLVIFDSLRVIAYRLFVLHKNPMKGDYTHFHHRLLANGWTRSEVRRFVRIRSSVLSILMILQGTNSMNKRIILGMIALLFLGVNIYLFGIKKLPTEEKIGFTTEEAEQ